MLPPAVVHRLSPLVVAAMTLTSAAGCGEATGDRAEDLHGLARMAATGSQATPAPRVVPNRDGRLVDENGAEVHLHGLNYFGFNTDERVVHGLWGNDPMNSDLATHVWRQRLLGFNAVRLPFSFQQLARPAPQLAKDCSPVAAVDVVRGALDPQAGAGVDLGRAPPLPAPPQRQAGRCNEYLPTDGSARDLYAWVVQFYVRNGFYVLMDNHFREDRTVLTSPEAWAASWAGLVAQVMREPAARGRVFVDLLNEPDEHGVAWQAAAGKPGLETLYLSAMDAIWAQTHEVTFFVEGAGQLGLGTNWGDGFCADQGKIARLGLSSPRSFFEQVGRRPYASQVVLAPHVYGPAVTHLAVGSSGPGLVSRLDDSFGDLASFGYASGGGGSQTFPVAIGEFGSFFTDPGDLAFLADFAHYLRRSGPASDSRRRAINAWFYWSYNPNSGDTGGLVADDWRTLQWTKIRYLVDELGLTPWWRQAASGSTAPAATRVPADLPAAASATSAVAARPPAATGALAVDLSAAGAGAPAAPEPSYVTPPAPAWPAAARSCRARVHVDGAFPLSDGSWGATVNIYLQQQGSSSIEAPYVITLREITNRSVTQTWNVQQVTPAGPDLRLTIGEPWQRLAPGAAELAVAGLQLTGPSRRLAIGAVLVNGAACVLAP